MTMKRNSSTKGGIKKKIPKLVDTEDIMDYTKLLTSENVETVEYDNEQKLDVAKKPKKIKPAKNNQIVQKKVLKTGKENGVLKKIKGKPSSSTGINLLIY